MEQIYILIDLLLDKTGLTDLSLKFRIDGKKEDIDREIV